MKKYEYTPLADGQSVRILRLNPGQSAEPLAGIIEVIKASDLEGLEYEPISYAWGSDHTRNHRIICDGRVLGLSASLHGALRRLQFPERPRTLWADQICINQDDNLERSNQIQFMHTIFKYATRVLVWLGEDVDLVAESAFHLLRKLSKTFEDDDQTIQFGVKYGRHYAQQSADEWKPLQTLTQVSWVSLQIVLHDIKNMQNAHVRLFSKFERVWIVQEIGTKAPAKIFWGTAEIDWDVVHNVCHNLAQFYHFRKLFSISTSRIKYLYQRFIPPERESRHENRFSFIYELHRGRHLKASDSRDRVFAMLGHYSIRQEGNAEIMKLRPSYQMSTEDVYIDLARRALLEDRSSLVTLAAVQHVELPKPHSDTTEAAKQAYLPSWVPDWRNYQSHILSEPTTPHRASNMIPNVEFDLTHRVLSIRGAIVAKIASCSRSLKHGDFHHDKSIESPTIQILWNTICKHDRFDLCYRYVTGESAFFAYTQTLSNGCVAIAWHQKRRYREIAIDEWSRHGAAYVVEALKASPIVSEHVRKMSQGGSAHEWVRAASGASTNRRFGRSECGRYVLGPDVMRQGDLLCVLFGGKMPFILRPVDSYYQLVGECYSHGLMNDDISDILRRSEAKETVFDIY